MVLDTHICCPKTGKWSFEQVTGAAGCGESGSAACRWSRPLSCAVATETAAA